MNNTAIHFRPVYPAIRSGLAVLLLATTACTQPPAKVVLRGQNIYGPEGATRVASATRSAPVYRSTPAVQETAPVSYVPQETQQSASIQSIGVSDLPPPVASAPAPALVESKPISQAPKTQSVDVAADDKAQPVNLWTKEPHFAAKPQQEETKIASVKADAATPGLLDQNVKSAQAVGYMWPVSSKKVLTSFGPKAGGRISDGLDIASASGEPVWASAGGEVVFVGDELKGYGNMVLIKHPDGKTTTYAHLSRASVDKYDRVKQGDIIGYVGATGNVRDPQLYFAINEGKTALDPQKYLSRSVAGL